MSWLPGKFRFAGAAQAVVLYDVVHSDPPPLSRIRNDLPDTLVQIVAKALQKRSR